MRRRPNLTFLVDRRGQSNRLLRCRRKLFAEIVLAKHHLNP